MSDCHVQECYVCSPLAQFSTNVSFWFCCLTTHILLSEAEKSQFTGTSWTGSCCLNSPVVQEREEVKGRLYFLVKRTEVQSLNVLVKKKKGTTRPDDVMMSCCLEKCRNLFQKYIWMSWICKQRDKGRQRMVCLSVEGRIQQWITHTKNNLKRNINWK